MEGWRLENGIIGVSERSEQFSAWKLGDQSTLFVRAISGVGAIKEIRTRLRAAEAIKGLRLPSAHGILKSNNGCHS